jgi:hypothetical protein
MESSKEIRISSFDAAVYPARMEEGGLTMRGPRGRK